MIQLIGYTPFDTKPYGSQWIHRCPECGAYFSHRWTDAQQVQVKRVHRGYKTINVIKCPGCKKYIHQQDLIPPHHPKFGFSVPKSPYHYGI